MTAVLRAVGLASLVTSGLVIGLALVLPFVDELRARLRERR